MIKTDSKRVVMTQEGYDAKSAELDDLVRNVRHAKIAAVAKAKALGDLSENAEYHEARKEQSIVEGKIAELENTLARAEVVDASKFSGDTIKFGAYVTIQNQDDNSVSSYRIVSEIEADIQRRQISISSPMGRALINKKLGDFMELSLPTGERCYKIMKVEYK